MADEAWHRDFVRWAQSQRARRDRLWSADEVLPVEHAALAELRRQALGAGLAWTRGEWFQPATPEVTASLTAHTAALDELPARSLAVTDRLPFLMMSRRALGRGAPLDALLGAVRPGPAEAQLEHARLLRLELAALGDPLAAAGKQVAGELLELWAAHNAAAVQSRCMETLLRLSRNVDVAVLAFSEAVARAIAGSRRSDALRAAPGEIDDALTALLSGRPANDLQLTQAEHVSARARRHAYLAGALAGQHPLWWNDAWRALRSESADLARAFLGGTALTLGDARLASALLESVEDARTEVRIAGWAALAAAQSPVSAEPLAAIAREPSAEARAEVAGCPRLPLSSVPLLHALRDDPDPGVRAAALFNLASLDALDADDLRGAATDARARSFDLRRSGARALAAAGFAELTHGEALAGAALDEAAGVGLSAAHALAIWAGPEAHWRELYQRAAHDRRWLAALGEALSDDWCGLFPAPPELREPLRVHALKSLGDEDAQLAAAHVLRVHSDPNDAILDIFSTRDLPASELTVLTLVAATAHRPRAQLVDPLWAWIDDGSAELAARRAALSALGNLAPCEPATLARVAKLLDGELANESYYALAQIAGRNQESR